MTEESDMALFVFQARVILVVDRSVLAGFGDVAFEDHFAVQRNADVVALDSDLFAVPFADRFQETAFGRNNAVHRTVILVFLELAVNRGFVVEHLNLHADISGIAFERGPDSDPVVRAFGQHEVEAEDEVFVLVDRI